MRAVQFASFEIQLRVLRILLNLTVGFLDLKQQVRVSVNRFGHQYEQDVSGEDQIAKALHEQRIQLEFPPGIFEKVQGARMNLRGTLRGMNSDRNVSFPSVSRGTNPRVKA